MRTSDQDPDFRVVVEAYEQLAQGLERSGDLADEHREALERFGRILDDFVGHRALEVSDAGHQPSRELRPDARTTTDFLVSLTHDLRGPIAALVHQAELLTTVEVPEPVRQRSRAALQENAGLLAQMLDALVEIERFALGELTVDPVPTPLVDLVQDLHDLDGTDRASIEVVLPSDSVTVSVDSAAMRRALRTVVNTGLRGSDDAHLTIEASEADGDVIITISSSSDVPIDPTAPADSRIDMRLARTVIDLHGGELGTAPGQGAADVTISLPRTDDDGVAR